MAKLGVNSKLGVKVNFCEDCGKYNIGTHIHDLFNWEKFHLMMGFDKESNEILLVEEQLMRIIQMVNPAQAVRKIRLVSQEELWKR